MRSALILFLFLFLSACSSTKAPLKGVRQNITFSSTADRPVPSRPLPIVLGSQVPLKNWTHTAGNAQHLIENPRLPDRLRRLWRVPFGSPGEPRTSPLLSSPIVAEGRVFTLDALNRVQALDAHTGKDVWMRRLRPFKEGVYGGGLAYAQGYVFVTTSLGDVTALSIKDGTPLWSQHITDEVVRVPPVVAGGRVFVVDISNSLYALNARTGTLLWVASGTSVPTTLLGGGGVPAVVRDIVIAPSSSGSLRAFDPGKGTLLWRTAFVPLENNNSLLALPVTGGAPVIDGQRVFIANNGNHVAMLGLADGHRIWDRTMSSNQTPWVTKNVIYLLTTNNRLVALSRTDGSVLWRTPLPIWLDPEEHQSPAIWYGPIMAGDRLFLTSNKGALWSVSPREGHVLRKLSLRAPIWKAPVVAGGKLYVQVGDGTLAAFG